MKGVFLMITGLSLILSSFILFMFVPQGVTGSLVLTPEGCASVRAAGGTTTTREGLCIAGGQYARRLSGWIDLKMGPELAISLSPQSVLMTTDDGRIPELDWTLHQRLALIGVFVCLLLGPACVWLGIRSSGKTKERTSK